MHPAAGFTVISVGGGCETSISSRRSGGASGGSSHGLGGHQCHLFAHFIVPEVSLGLFTNVGIVAQKHFSITHACGPDSAKLCLMDL